MLGLNVLWTVGQRRWVLRVWAKGHSQGHSCNMLGSQPSRFCVVRCARAVLSAARPVVSEFLLGSLPRTAGTEADGCRRGGRAENWRAAKPHIARKAQMMSLV